MNDNTPTDTNVVTLRGNKPKCTCPPPEELVLVCPGCNCQSFRFISTGDIRCANCDFLIEPDVTDTAEEKWRKILTTVPEEGAGLEDDGGTITVKAMGDASLARRRVVKRVNEWNEAGELAIVLAYNEEGAGSHWLSVASKEQKEWCIRKLKEVLAHTEASNVSD